jgi:nucleotide-binding universal stress UspA family protein
MRLLVCSIGSKKNKSTLRFARQVAGALAAQSTLLGVVEKQEQAEWLSQRLEEVAEWLANRDLVAHVRVEVGNPEDVVMAELEAATYDMIAVGALGGKRSRRRFLNSVGMRIVELSRSSVLLIKGDRSDLSRVLICASGAEHGHLAVWAGATLACGSGARVTVLHVVDAMPAMYAGLEQMEETLAELLQTDTEKSRQLKWAAQVVKAECDISELKLRRGIVADEIIQESQEGDYDVIVMGSSRISGGLVRVLMGDVTREVATRAERPVLVVRPAE